MKKVIVPAALILLACGFMLLAGCPNNNNNPTGTNTTHNITVSIGSPGTSGGAYGSYYYTSSAGSFNSSNGLFTLSCHGGDIINLPSGGPHTLWFDQGGSGTCITGFAGETSASMAYTFASTTSPVTYYFQCGVHGNCSDKASCSATTCTGMAAVVYVSP